jgi:hypothetical protein
MFINSFTKSKPILENVSAGEQWSSKLGTRDLLDEHRRPSEWILWFFDVTVQQEKAFEML